MQRNLRFGGRITIKKWVSQVLELNGYLKDFPAHNRNSIQPLDKDKLLNILEYEVPASWLEKSCEPSADKPKGEKNPKSENAGKRKADDTTPTKPVGERKFFCDMHGRNRTHNTEDCFELKWHVQ
eukprot:8666889-Ditylum_brightwellii.AAC.1